MEGICAKLLNVSQQKYCIGFPELSNNWDRNLETWRPERVNNKRYAWVRQKWLWRRRQMVLLTILIEFLIWCTNFDVDDGWLFGPNWWKHQITCPPGQLCHRVLLLPVLEVCWLIEARENVHVSALDGLAALGEREAICISAIKLVREIDQGVLYLLVIIFR